MGVLTLADDAYPGMLRNIPDPPPTLYVDGRVPEMVCVALVGSRKASATGIEMARTLEFALAERGVCVVSGLALGVDAAAHEGAVDAGDIPWGCSGAASISRIRRGTNGFTQHAAHVEVPVRVNVHLQAQHPVDLVAFLAGQLVQRLGHHAGVML